MKLAEKLGTQLMQDPSMAAMMNNMNSQQYRSDMESKIQFSEETTDQSLFDLRLESVLFGFLDETTRAHTTQLQGGNQDIQIFKRAVVKFCNGNMLNNTNGKTNKTAPMQIG